ncbi:hypothetical protein GCM10011506_29960 [Marivirga lumbricoides]|uniref:DUF4248 domain-containing protein n=1 Tax=Marivirga lumbricoides TaxID=1046115 RepID=A0ABQ1MSY2_9BACT|nr:hypothetical protein GCM10011506_29960 [Marivirga lumbricoides]
MENSVSPPSIHNSSLERVPSKFDDEQLPKVKAYYKYELAEMYNVCTKTFSTWIHMYFEELQQFGYTRHTKLLRPEIVRFLFERLGEP